MTFRTPVALLAAAALSVGAAACGDDDETTPAATGPKPAAEVPALTGKDTQVTLAQGFLDALTSLKATPGPVGDAKIDGAVATFPITGGNVKYYDPASGVKPYVQGIINHDGSGLSLEAGGKKVELENFDVDPGKSILTGDVSVDGAEAAADAPLFFLDGRTLKPIAVNTGTSTAVLEGTTVVLTKTAADLLNKTFGITALTNKVVVGTAKITVNTK